MIKTPDNYWASYIALLLLFTLLFIGAFWADEHRNVFLLKESCERAKERQKIDSLSAQALTKETEVYHESSR